MGDAGDWQVPAHPLQVGLCDYRVAAPHDEPH